MRIGIDVGGTHTDAVLMDGETVVASTKQITSADIGSGIEKALSILLKGQSPTYVDLLTIGTTQFTNAVLERRQLSKVAAVRFCAPAGRGLAPRQDWPKDLADVTDGGSYLLQGGYLYDGRPLAPIEPSEVDALIASLKSTGVKTVVITAAFSPNQPEFENRLHQRLSVALPDTLICVSHEIGGLGLIERENATLLNASLLSFADHICNSLVQLSRGMGLKCPVHVSQNDGTLVDLERVRRYPALTFASGPTNSIRGAWALTGLSDAIVVDIGGTTSDIGVLKHGFPRQSNLVIELGGVRTNFRMPDILSIGLGGGSVVIDDGYRIGPQSVGSELFAKARCFGGDVLTFTDVAVAKGRLKISGSMDKGLSDPSVLETADSNAISKLSAAVDLMKPGGKTLPVILVGGGATLIGGDTLAGCPILRPENGDVANAIGASIAQVSGEAERMVIADSRSRIDTTKLLVDIAGRQAKSAGALETTLKTIDIEEIDIPYMAQDTVRIRVKVVGDLET